MKVIRAIEISNSLIENVLTEAGLVNGQTLSDSQIVNENGVIFWELSVTSKEASAKETYVTYEVYQVEPTTFFDGQDPIRTAKSVISVYSRKKNALDLLKQIENAFLQNGWTFELESRGYDFSGQSYYHIFNISKRVDEV